MPRKAASRGQIPRNSDCVHHWLVASPSPELGEKLPAVCKKCGRERAFSFPTDDMAGRDWLREWRGDGL